MVLVPGSLYSLSSSLVPASNPCLELTEQATNNKVLTGVDSEEEGAL